ncbi:MAG TPA: transporter substrate-binding domain-containing protein [Azospirillaceae bacterium]|nr:transporter substrate-binding domain-containing protein [Azospirillaceae bacterium]
MLKLSGAAVLVTLSLCTGALAQTAGGEPVTIGVPTNPPLTMFADGKGQGIIHDLSVAALEKMGYTVVGRDLPFARLYQEIHGAGVDVAISVLKTPERSTQALYSDPIITEYNVMVAKKGAAFALATTDDLPGRKIGTRNGFKYPLLDVRTDLTLDPGGDHLMNVRKLVAGRLDGMIVGSVSGLAQLKENQFGDQIEVLPNSIGKVPLGTALSSKRFTQADLDRFNATVAELRAGPAFAEIVARYNAGDLVKEYPVVPK